jgi:hypothetical protein
MSSVPLCMRGQNSTVSVATCYGLVGQRFERRWGEEIFFIPIQTSAGSKPASCSMATGASCPRVQQPGHDVCHSAIYWDLLPESAAARAWCVPLSCLLGPLARECSTQGMMCATQPSTGASCPRVQHPGHDVCHSAVYCWGSAWVELHIHVPSSPPLAYYRVTLTFTIL